MNNKIKWRPYQIECKKSIREAYKSGITEQLIVQATGTGKRIASIDIMRHFNRSLFIAHREELIMQPYEDLQQTYPMEVGIVKGPLFEIDKKIVVASVQTLYNRLDKIDPEMFDYIVIDEAHHYLSKSYLASIRHFKPKLLTGWTATPKRLDGLSLSNLFEKIVFEYHIDDGIKDKWLAPIEAYQIKTQVNLKGVKRTAGDFNTKDLSERVDIPERNEMIVEKYNQYSNKEQAIAFCVDIDHSMNLRDKFRDAGISCESISSDPIKCPNRTELVSKFKEGKIQVITNVNILCLDLKTEILTRRGWLKWDQMKYNDLVANYTLDGKIFFKKPDEIVKRKLYDFEQMTVVKTKQSNIRVTNTHRMIYKSGTNGNWHKTSAEKLINKNWIYPSCGEAQPVKFNLKQPYIISESKKKRLITASAYNLRKRNGYEKQNSIIEAINRTEKKLSLRYKNPNELSFDELRLIGFWLGDGSINKLIRQGAEYTICQSKVYPEIIKYIDGLLIRCNIHFIKRDKGNYFVWSLPRGTGSGSQKRNGVFHLEPYLNKNGTELFWGLNKLQISSLIEGLWHADGLHGQAYEIPETKVIGSTFYDLLSILQAILVCRGFKANIRKTTQRDLSEKNSDLYILTIENRKVQSIMSQKKEFQMNYDSIIIPEEEVWCVKTESKNIITRREGCVCIMGNTEGFDYQDVGIIIMARPTQSETLYVQAIGRGTRLKSESFKESFGHDKCTVLDFVDNSANHSLVNAYSLEEGIPIEDRMFIPKEYKDKLIAEKEKRIARINADRNLDQRIDLFQLPEVQIWNSGKMLESATEKQLNWMKSLGVYQEDVEYTKKMASEIISYVPAQNWQVNWLKRNGYETENRHITIGQYQIAKRKFDIENKYKPIR